jgi:hypothetical protein
MSLLTHPRTNAEAPTGADSAGVAREAENRLRQSGYLVLRDVSCRAGGGVVSLHGCLPSYYLKQLAQEIVAGVAGTRLIVNRIEVFVPPQKIPATKGGRNDVGPEPQAE